MCSDRSPSRRTTSQEIADQRRSRPAGGTQIERGPPAGRRSCVGQATRPTRGVATCHRSPGASMSTPDGRPHTWPSTGGPPRVHDRRHDRSRSRPDRHRDQVDPRRQDEPCRGVRARRAGRGVAGRGAHRALGGRQPDESRAAPRPQAAAPPDPDRPAARTSQGQGPDRRTAPGVHHRARHRQGRARAREASSVRQAPRHRRARRPSQAERELADSHRR
jgi:hypothetical protein